MNRIPRLLSTLLAAGALAGAFAGAHAHGTVGNSFPADDYLQWDDWERLDIPVLCLRGESSDLLLPDVADKMRTTGPRAVVAEIKECGHAPALNTPAQWALVERFLAG